MKIVGVDMRSEMLRAYDKGVSDQKEQTNTLQERIDKALQKVYSEKNKAECDVYSNEVADFIFGFGYELHEILTGVK